MKNKLIIFHQALAPYRIDFFNDLNRAFDTKIYFNDLECESQSFDLDQMRSRINFDWNILKGKKVKSIRFQIFSILRKEKPDLVIANEFSLNLALVLLCRKIFNINYKVFNICDDSYEMAQNSRVIRKLSRSLLLRFIDGVILCNDGGLNWYQTHFPSVNYTNFPIIAEDDFFRNQLKETLPIAKKYIKQYDLEGKKVILFVGRLVKVKNLPYLLNSFGKINDPDARLVLVGSGDEETYLKEIIKSKGLENKVIFTGRFDGPELIAWYNIGQLFVLSSYSEAFGAVVNEALIAGIPSFVSDKAGASCLINETNGKVFSINNDDELYEVLNERIELIKPLASDELKVCPSLMPFTYKDQMRNLIKWITSF